MYKLSKGKWSELLCWSSHDRHEFILHKMKKVFFGYQERLYFHSKCLCVCVCTIIAHNFKLPQQVIISYQVICWGRWKTLVKRYFTYIFICHEKSRDQDYQHGIGLDSLCPGCIFVFLFLSLSLSLSAIVSRYFKILNSCMEA